MLQDVVQSTSLTITRFVIAIVLLSPLTALAAPGRQFADLSPAKQQEIQSACKPPDLSERDGPYSTPMYYLMHKGYAYEGDWDADSDSRCYEKLKGQRGKEWGNWTLDRNRPDWQAAMIKDWAELGLNSTHLNIYPVNGKLDIEPDWAEAIGDFVTLSEQHGLKVGVRIDAPDETKLWSVHPNNPQSQRAEYLDWVAEVVQLLKGRTIYYVLGDELTLKQPAAKLPKQAWTPPMYLDYFREVSAVIKQADPDAKVCMFAASSGEWFNVKWLLEHGYAQLGDGVAINHYDYNTAPSFFADRDRYAPGKMFLTSGVGYVSNGVVQDRYPEGDSYTPLASEREHAAQIAKTMFMWWDLGADAAPYYITLRNWRLEGKNYPRWFGFFGIEDYVVENDRLSVRRYPAWYAFQTVAQTFYNRKQMRAPDFAVKSSAPISQLRSFVHAVPGGRELLLMVWNEEGEVETMLTLENTEFRYPVKVSLAGYRQWDSLQSNVDDKNTTLRITAGTEPQIIRFTDIRKP